MKWLKLTIETTSEASDAISEMLTSLGVAGVEIYDPNEYREDLKRAAVPGWADDKFLRSLGNIVKVNAYFEPEEFYKRNILQLIKEKLKLISGFLNAGSLKVTSSEMKDEDWKNNWKQFYKPMRISKKVVIKPTWEEYSKNKNDIIVEIDPGMAFGTGLHETTRMCSVLLEKYLKAGDTVLDIGCGTGILSIIASKLGASFITAVDIDEIAVKATKINTSLNGVKNIDIFKGELKNVIQTKYNFIAANIIADVIIDIGDMVFSYLKDEGIIVTSGIIKERANEVIKKYEDKGFRPMEVLYEGEWVAIAFGSKKFL